MGKTDRRGNTESMLQAIGDKTGKVRWSNKFVFGVGGSGGRGWEGNFRKIAGVLSTAGNVGRGVASRDLQGVHEVRGLFFQRPS